MFRPGLWWHGWPAGGEGRAMGQVLHGSATTTEAIRRAIQRSEESVRALARRHGVSPTTVQKWRRRRTTADARMGPKEVRSTTLSPEQEAMAVAFRRHTLLPLDDCLYALQPSIPELTRSGLHRCFARHGISRLPKAGDDGAGKKRFKAYPIGYFHLDIAEVRTEQAKLHLFVAIDRTSKFAFARLHEKATRRVAADFLHGVEHRLTKPYHPWTNGQVERMNRTLKDATVRRYHYGSHDELRAHLALFLDAYNHARRLKAIRGLTPYEFICQAWTREPERFRLNPLHHTPGLNS